MTSRWACVATALSGQVGARNPGTCWKAMVHVSPGLPSVIQATDSYSVSKPSNSR
jgi:hypothetical protein